MENVNKYIGIPYRFNGDTADGCDCLGLVRYFYREHGWIDVDDGLPINKEDWMNSAVRRIKNFFPKNFDVAWKPEDMKYGAVVLFKINSELHFGVYLGYGRLLSTQLTTESYDNSRSTIYKREWWTPWFKVAFNRKE
jgi:cell wall-associated NlpC family hydrolase